MISIRSFHIPGRAAAAAIFSIGISAGASAAPGDPLTPIIPVLSSADQNPDPGASQVGHDSAGNFIVAWSSDVPTSGTRFFVRRFGVDGTPLGNQILAVPPPIDSSPPALAVDAAGDFVLAWSTMFEIIAQAFHPDGSPATAPITVLDKRQPPDRDSAGLPINFVGYGDPTVSMAPNGEFIVAWTVQLNYEFSPVSDLFPSPVINPESRIDYRRYHLDGTPAGGQQTAVRYSASLFFATSTVITDPPLIRAGADGSYVIGYRTNGVSPFLAPILQPTFHAQRIGADGAPDGLPMALLTTGALGLFIDHYNFGFGLAANGDFLLAWTTSARPPAAVGPEDLYFRRYSRLGLPIGLPQLVAERASAVTRPIVGVAPLADGGTIIAWADVKVGKDPQFTPIANFGRAYDSRDRAVSGPFTISDGIAGGDVTATADGNKLIASFGGVFARIFSTH